MDNYLTRDFLYSKVLKRDLEPDDRSLDVNISNLRKKIGTPSQPKEIGSEP